MFLIVLLACSYEADLSRKCMLRDGLMLLPDCFTANDINDYLCGDRSLMYE